MRLTLIAYRRIKSPMKFTIYASVLSRWPKILKRTNPVSAVNMAKRKMTMPANECHGSSFALVDFSAPGKQ